MRFSKRIQAITAMVPKCDTISEIGCDHGKIMLSIMMARKAKRGLACDISEKSLAKAQALFGRYPYDVQAICCDGLEQAGEAGCAVIAGIGGVNIADILDGNTGVDMFVLQPSDNTAQLRRYLVESGYGILDEDIVHDSRYYSIIYAVAPHALEADQHASSFDTLEFEIGPVNMGRRNAECMGYAAWRLSIYEKALRNPAENERGRVMQAKLEDMCAQLRSFIEG